MSVCEPDSGKSIAILIAITFLACFAFVAVQDIFFRPDTPYEIGIVSPVRDEQGEIVRYNGDQWLNIGFEIYRTQEERDERMAEIREEIGGRLPFRFAGKFIAPQIVREIETQDYPRYEFGYEIRLN